MPLRTRAEIEAKIAELEKSAEELSRKRKKIRTILIFMVAVEIAGFIFIHLNKSYTPLFYVFLPFCFVCLGIIIVLGRSEFEYSRNSALRNTLALHLKDILLHIDKPDAEDFLTRKLDQMIIYKNENKGKKKFRAAVDQKKFLVNYMNAGIQAYTWAVSPGMDFREKAEK